MSGKGAVMPLVCGSSPSVNAELENERGAIRSVLKESPPLPGITRHYRK
jgi:hypothetical protein